MDIMSRSLRFQVASSTLQGIFDITLNKKEDEIRYELLASSAIALCLSHSTISRIPTENMLTVELAFVHVQSVSPSSLMKTSE